MIGSAVGSAVGSGVMIGSAVGSAVGSEVGVASASCGSVVFPSGAGVSIVSAGSAMAGVSAASAPSAYTGRVMLAARQSAANKAAARRSTDFAFSIRNPLLPSEIFIPQVMRNRSGGTPACLSYCNCAVAQPLSICAKMQRLYAVLCNRFIYIKNYTLFVSKSQ